MTTQSTTNPIKRSSRRCATLVFLFIPFLLVCFALSQRAQATEPHTILPNGNTAEGSGVLVSLTSGVWNSGFGFQALNHDTAGKLNTATGVRALFSTSSGSNNTATGVYALYSNTIGWYNNAVGAYALANNTEGTYNTANGYGALYYNTEGYANTATGFAALYRNTTGSTNTANGYRALYSNSTGFGNTATGRLALQSNTTGNYNTANGYLAFNSNTTGNFNTANGYRALGENTTGSTNTALGREAGLGVTTANDVICIGTFGENVSNSCYIGQIFGKTSSGGTSVFINSDGKLGTTTSSRRFKEEIRPMERASEVLFALKPVSFRYKKGIDPQGNPQFGLVAEDVEAVNPDLVVRDKEGKVNTVRYEAVNVMLLNEFLKEHRKVEAQEATITRLKSTVAQQRRDFQATVAHQQKQIEALTAGLQRVSAQVEMSRPSPRTVDNNH